MNYEYLWIAKSASLSSSEPPSQPISQDTEDERDAPKRLALVDTQLKFMTRILDSISMLQNKLGKGKFTKASDALKDFKDFWQRISVLSLQHLADSWFVQLGNLFCYNGMLI